MECKYFPRSPCKGQVLRNFCIFYVILAFAVRQTAELPVIWEV